MAQTLSTPLLLLLDGVTGDSDETVYNALVELSELHPPVVSTNMAVPRYATNLRNDPQELVKVISHALQQHPWLARTASSHDGSLPLHFAASLGRVTVGSVLLQSYPQASSTPNDKGKIPLHYAAREGRDEMVRFLISNNPRTAAIASKKDKLALHFAAGEGHVAIVQALLSAYPRGASLPSAKGKVPLHFASRWGHLPVALDLLYLFPDGIRTLDWEGSLPLHDAAREGQYQMCRFLVERFPGALATANLRGDIPLFPVVRSGNLDAVAYMIQVWPEGGKHILQNLTEVDCLADWTPGTLELLLRGSVDNFEGCAILKGRESPTLRLISEIYYVASEGDNDRKKAKKAAKTAEVAAKDDDTIEHRVPRLLNRDAHATTSTPFSESRRRKGKESSERCKSPVLLEQMQDERDSRLRRRKRARRNGTGEASHDADSARVFVPLLAALQAEAPVAVIDYLLVHSPNDVSVEDDDECYALHHAVTWANPESEKATQIVLRIFRAFPGAATKRDITHRYPLLAALAAQADVRVVKALLEAHPSAGIEPCSLAHESSQHLEKPLDWACRYGCGVDTLFELLRVDPSYVENRRQRPVA